ncbi:hypothetical protein [Thiohalophilus sp.]|uniref:hypothetical protein n=1 Tax=Thiohalophilus sp. TaxID=3028392 RepID=UPI003975032A
MGQGGTGQAVSLKWHILASDMEEVKSRHDVVARCFSGKAWQEMVRLTMTESDEQTGTLSLAVIVYASEVFGCELQRVIKQA